MKQAFAGPDLEAEFLELKERAVDDELDISNKKRKIMSEGAFNPALLSWFFMMSWCR